MEQMWKSALRKKTVPENGPLFSPPRVSETVIHFLYEFNTRNETLVHPFWNWTFVL